MQYLEGALVEDRKAIAKFEQVVKEEEGKVGGVHGEEGKVGGV